MIAPCKYKRTLTLLFDLTFSDIKVKTPFKQIGRMEKQEYEK